MPYYIICGKPDCIRFNHATYVAQYLREHLPNFKYKKIEKSNQEFGSFVNQLNKAHKWYLTKSPIIWKELRTWGGKPHLIGGLSEFWEHCYCYYGLESNIPKSDLEKLTADNVKFFNEEKERTQTEKKHYYAVIGIIGATHCMVPYILEEMVVLPELNRGAGILIKLFDMKLIDNAGGTIHASNHHHIDHHENITDVAEYINEAHHFGSKETVKFVHTHKDLIEKTDMLIIVEEYNKQAPESQTIYLVRLREQMADLAETITCYAKRNLKVIIVNGPSCFLATVLVELALTLNVGSIVAVSSDLGLPVLKVIHEITKVPVHQMSAPPVWGFAGLNHFVDERNVIFKATIYRPYQRALTAPDKSTLPLGTSVPEIRLMSYMLPDQHEEIKKMVEEQRKKTKSILNRYPFRPKLRALISLIKIWYSDKDHDSIISLGIYSTGAFDIPAGLVFSQPAILDDQKRWRPFYDFPLVSEITKKEVKKCIEETLDSLALIGFDLTEEGIGEFDGSVLEFDELNEEKEEEFEVKDAGVKLSLGSNKKSFDNK